MLLGKMKSGLIVVMAMTVLSAGASALSLHALNEQPVPSNESDGARPADEPPDKAKPEAKNAGASATRRDNLPDKALHRLGSRRLRHEHQVVLSTAFSPDGKILATSSDSVRLWDTATGDLLREIEGRFWPRLLFSPDSKVLAIQETLDAVCLREPATGKVLHRLPKENRLAAFSPDGKRLATSAPGLMRFWDTTNWRCNTVSRERLGFDHEEGFTYAFSADGLTLVAACWKAGVVYHWDVPEGKLRKTVQLSLPRTRQACLSSDGRLLAAAPYNNRDAVALWDTETGRPRGTLEGEDAGTDLALALSPDGKSLATALFHGREPTTISLWDAGTGKRLRRISAPPGSGYVLQFAPDKRTLLSSGYGPRVRLWDTATGKQLLADSDHEGEITSLSFTPDSRTLLSADGDGVLQTWNVASGRPRRRLAIEGWGWRAVALAADGKSVFSGGRDGWIRLHDLESGEQRRRFGIDRRHEILSLAVTPDGRTAVSWSVTNDPPSGVFHVWDVATGTERTHRPDPVLAGSRLFSPDGKLVLTRVDKPVAPPADEPDGGARPPLGIFRPSSLLLQETASGRIVHRLPQPDSFGLVQAFAPDGRTLVTATGQMHGIEGVPSGQHALHIWDVATGKERRTIAPPQRGAAYRFEHLAIAPDGHTLAAVRADRTILFWDLRTGAELLRRSGFNSSVNCLVFSPDSRILATGHADSTILLWDVASRPGPAAKNHE